MNGLLLVNKPVGITTYDVIREIKKSTEQKLKIGHAGTLDPFAEGLVIIMLGSFTKSFDAIQKLPKTYIATAILGQSSDTLDNTGQIKNHPVKKITKENIENETPEFLGEIEQTVPAFSAIKIKGTPAYKLARTGKLEKTNKKKPVTIYELILNNKEENKVTFTATVSSGTYIRQLSYDLFKKLDNESLLTELKRTQIGPFKLTAATNLSNIKSGNWQKNLITPNL